MASFERPAEEALDRVQNNPLGSDLVDGVCQADEESLEVVLARLVDLAAVDMDVIHNEFAVFDQLVEIEAE